METTRTYLADSPGKGKISSVSNSYYTITSLTGQNMLHQSVTTSVTRIDISSLSPGIYIVRVSAGGRVETWKIIKNQ
ncbi:MAG: T9SS type A sorting domain-containing protein [Alphaproteobacteria bacterium]|nr:T9SS type A sorting domain-containing protein [Alphaproteobacteria bacterium]